ncbi:helix-turn-helix transcriptional regulator [Streptomyces bryophytorum]|nr:helix-turn-helix transcriptional regulator [Actinacidiphila bryophytorum]MBN6542830.1 helix-turn-helix transcriptional regulator [Actinacidiphila bryophytorum]
MRRPQAAPQTSQPGAGRVTPAAAPGPVTGPLPVRQAPAPREPLWRDLVGDALRRERLAQERTLKDVAEQARISVPYLSELERGRKEGSSEVIAAAAHALGLGLADLLSLAQDELARHARSRVARGRTSSPSAHHNGLCLVA